MSHRHIHVLLGIMLCRHALAGCEVESAHLSPALAEPTRSILSGFYVVHCVRGGGHLINSYDPTLGSRFAPPRDPVFPVPTLDPYRAQARKLRIQHPVDVVFIVDPDGNVGDVAIIASSGNAGFDSTMMKLCHKTRWRHPATLDQVPVRVMHRLRFQFTD